MENRRGAGIERGEGVCTKGLEVKGRSDPVTS